MFCFSKRHFLYINMGHAGRFKKTRLAAALIILMAALLCPTASAAAEGTDAEQGALEQQLKSSEIEKLEDEISKYSSSLLNEIIPGYDTKKAIEDTAKGRFRINLVSILNRLLNRLFKELYQNLHILAKLVALAILCAILKNLQTSFLSESIVELAFYACYVVIVSLLVFSFNSVLNIGRGAVDNMIAFMHASIPIMITLLVSSGNVTSGGAFQPILIMAVEVAGTLIRNVFIPLIMLSTVVSLVDNISDKIQITKLAAFMKQISIWSLGIILTLFIAVISLQGSLGAVVDGVASKTAKFAIGAFIPVAGKYLADAADTVLGCTLLIKNAANVAVMLGIIAICLAPILKITAILILYRFTCILVEPVTEKRIVNCINEMAGSVTYIIGIVAAVGLMFLVSITAMISSSNISAMIR